MDQGTRDKARTIPEFDHETILWHYNHANRRMLTALIVVCVTFILTIVVFVHGYTVREQNWLRTLTNLNPAAEVKADGVHQQPDP